MQAIRIELTVLIKTSSSGTGFESKDFRLGEVEERWVGMFLVEGKARPHLE